MAFEIVGQFGQQALRQQRERPSGAILTAARWLESGVSDVLILWEDRTYQLQEFRDRFQLTRGGLRPKAKASSS